MSSLSQFASIASFASSCITRYHASFSRTSRYLAYPPRYSIVFSFAPLQADPELHIAIFDHDDMGTHDFLGDASLKVPAGT